MKNLKPGSFVKYRNLVVRCSKDCGNTCERCREEWKDLNCAPPCKPYNPNATCLKTFGWCYYPRPVKGQDYSSLKRHES